MTSGLSGSPAPTSSRSDSASRQAARSCCTSIRQTVGGAQKVVTLASRSTSSIALASKRA